MFREIRTITGRNTTKVASIIKKRSIKRLKTKEITNAAVAKAIPTGNLYT